MNNHFNNKNRRKHILHSSDKIFALFSASIFIYILKICHNAAYYVTATGNDNPHKMITIKDDTSDSFKYRIFSSVSSLCYQCSWISCQQHPHRQFRHTQMFSPIHSLWLHSVDIYGGRYFLLFEILPSTIFSLSLFKIYLTERQ